MAFTTPTTTRLTPSGGGWLWMDVTGGSAAADTLFYPVGGDGTSTTTAASADPGSGWVTFYGIQVLVAPTNETTVTVTGYDDIVVGAAATVGKFYPAIIAPSAAHTAGYDISSSATFANPGICLPSLSVSINDITATALSFRVFYRPETRGPA